MTDNINSQLALHEEFLSDIHDQSASLSKSKQLLKKCISEIGSTKEGRVATHQNHSGYNNERTGAQHHNKIKIAAPKPIRARPLGLTHMTSTSKWIETSPVKSENNDIFGQQEGKQCQSNQKETSLQFAEFLKMPKLNFQNDQNLSYEDESSQIHNLNNNSQNSELRSIMEAEQELNDIFSRSKSRYNDFSSSGPMSSHFGLQQQWSCEKNAANYRLNNNLNQSNPHQPLDYSVGFSNFGHFKAPIKRPTCNPIVKDERFKRLNNVNEESYKYKNMNTQDTMTDCNSQDVIVPNHYINQNNLYLGLQDLDSYDQDQYMFAFSQTTSPTGYSSRLHPFNSQMDHSGHYTQFQKSSNQSWYNNESVNHQAHVNSHIPFNDLMYTQQMQVQSQTHYNLQAQFAQINLSNSAPEYQNSYLQMFSSQNLQPQQYATYDYGLISGEHQLQDPSISLANQASLSQNQEYADPSQSMQLQQEHTMRQQQVHHSTIDNVFEDTIQHQAIPSNGISKINDDCKNEYLCEIQTTTTNNMQNQQQE